MSGTGFAERCGFVGFNDYAGYRTEHVRVIGETPKRYRCRFFSGRWKGTVRLVPKTAMRGILLPHECLEHDRRPCNA